MNVISLIQDSVATGIETWLCYVFCSVFLDINFFKKRKYQFAVAAMVSVLIVEVGDFFFPFSLGRSMISSTLVCYLFQVILYRKYYIKCMALNLFYMLMLAMLDFSILVVCSLTSGKSFDVFLSMSVYRIIATVIHTLILSFVVYLIYHISENTFQMGKRYVISLLVMSVLILVTILLIFQYFLSMGHIRLARTYTVQQENMLLNIHNPPLVIQLAKEEKQGQQVSYCTQTFIAGDYRAGCIDIFKGSIGQNAAVKRTRS